MDWAIAFSYRKMVLAVDGILYKVGLDHYLALMKGWPGPLLALIDMAWAITWL